MTSTVWCVGADNEAFAVAQELRDGLHARCPGAYRTPSGEVRACGCRCHELPVDLAEAAKGRLPIVDPPPADGPDLVDKGRKRAEKTAPRGRCEHCGEPCRARFLPGHDAKLKSDLAVAAMGGDVESAAELWLRAWWTGAGKRRTPTHVLEEGASLANARGYILVRERNARRQSR